MRRPSRATGHLIHEVRQQHCRRGYGRRLGSGQAAAEALAAAGIKVATFDLNETAGKSVAASIGGVFCKVDITSEESVVTGFASVRTQHGQERICVHCAQVSKHAKMLSYDQETGAYLHFPTEDYAFFAQGVLSRATALRRSRRRPWLPPGRLRTASAELSF